MSKIGRNVYDLYMYTGTPYVPPTCPITRTYKTL